MLDFDPNRLSASFFDDPYPVYARLREQAPIYRCPDSSFFLTRHAHLDRIYRDRRAFSSDKKAVFAPKFGVGTPLYEHHTTSLVFNDPPYHSRVRRAVVGALAPQVLKALEPVLTELIDALLDRIEVKREFDAVEDFAAAIPIEVIGNLLGIPRARRAPLRGWSLAILGALENTLTLTQEARGNQAVTDFLDYLRALVTAHNAASQGDSAPRDSSMLARLIHEQRAADPITEAELLHNCIFLLNAGHETTTNLIGNALYSILAHDDQRQRLLENPALIGTLVEEALRFESPNQLGNRLVIEPVDIDGVHLDAGAYLTLCIGAANRDPDAFPFPDRFDIGRSPNHHLAFAAGAHACAGMAVARLEAQLAIPPMFRRFPKLRLCEPPVRNHRARFRGLQALRLATS